MGRRFLNTTSGSAGKTEISEEMEKELAPLSQPYWGAAYTLLLCAATSMGISPRISTEILTIWNTRFFSKPWDWQGSHRRSYNFEKSPETLPQMIRKRPLGGVWRWSDAD